MLYFAYGSLLDKKRCSELCPTARPVGTAKVPHHSLRFTGASKVWEGGTATIGEAAGSDVWGGLYEIDEAGRRAIERSGEDDGYVWAFTSVESGDGARIQVGTLVKVRDFEDREPSKKYLKALRAGWKEWGLEP